MQKVSLWAKGKFLGLGPLSEGYFSFLFLCMYAALVHVFPSFFHNFFLKESIYSPKKIKQNDRGRGFSAG